MMESILQEKRISFKEFEKKIYQFVCGLGQEIARTMLEEKFNFLCPKYWHRSSVPLCYMVPQGFTNPHKGKNKGSKIT